MSTDQLDAEIAKYQGIIDASINGTKTLN